ncbi:hypothetical protein EV195_101664 [Tenacibaculum skagerrakense]|uniref:MG2 domain-containing protein n=1 Tax=Tenacibaculum skagerrakense TaxID=186571 RepID=A0A4V2SMT7_9FLAO|nr:hypothetical protein [Tenacibaculum skagerrakense]TCP28486.1 hypothetical protein EV195_101664 [Tenacibaculum skagerrakense]
MLRKKNIFILLIGTLVYQYSIFAQQEIDSSYVKYFQNTREVPYLHLNKTSYLQGEEIWFKAYIQEQNSQKLHTTTTNLYVSIFNENTSFKDQQLIHIINGVGYGSILLDSTYNGKNYYIKASTKWMKNFNEDNAFYQKISIVSSIEEEKKITVSEKDFFEFKLFPEGGHFVANTLNNIGILIKDYQNRGVKIQKGVIKDQNNNIIRKFNTNEFGMNNIRLFIKENTSYTFHATLSNGSKIKASTPLPESRGISLIVNSKDKNQVTVNVITNKETLKEIAGKQYRILVHNTRNYRNFPFTFKENNYNHALLLKPEELNPGINIITVFNNENKPISERLIYIKSEDLFQNIRVSNTKRMRNDSVAVKFTNPSNEKIFLSATFLPGNTQAYKPKNNIISTYLLRPYIKGSIQNPTKLLGETYKGQQRDLDLLLLIQGWSKYNWNDIFYNPPKTNFKFENGIDLTARLNKKLSSKQSIVLSSNKNKLIRIITHKENPWILKNSFLKKNSILNFGLSSNDNYFKIAPALSYSGGKLREKITNSEIELSKRLELEVSNFKPLKNEYENLNEVEVDANKKRRKTENHDKVYGGITMLTSARLENKMIASGETLLDFFKEKGYYDYAQDKVVLRGLGPKASLITESVEESDRFGRPLLRIFLDGYDISQEHWVLEQVYLNTIKEIFYGRNPGKLGEEIHIFRLNPAEYIDKRAEFAHIKIPIGFATEKEYYNPIYPSFTNDTYQKYGCMFWEPNIKLQGYLNKTIQIPANLQEKVLVYIEGITESGKLISKKVELIIK